MDATTLAEAWLFLLPIHGLGLAIPRRRSRDSLYIWWPAIHATTLAENVLAMDATSLAEKDAASLVAGSGLF